MSRPYKTKTTMKKLILFTTLILGYNWVSSQGLVQVGSAISNAIPLSGYLKGTMTIGRIYTISDDVTVDVGDTLLLQPGVTLKVGKGKTILVKGVFISLGTKALPNYIGPDITIKKTDDLGHAVSSDSAYVGYWTGINCEPSCTLLDLKWTRIEYTGAAFGTSFVPTMYYPKDNSHNIMFFNPDGDFIMEDSWVYGTLIDACRINSGRIHIMRNTFEKCGITVGEGLNAKSGTVGDMAYNLFVGVATNGTKASNKGGIGQQTNVNMYNNTYISGGYRQMLPTGRGGSINYEEGAKGKAFNNLMVNCRVGLRIHNNPAADVSNMSYVYNYSYGDSLRVMNNVYPIGASLTSGTTSVTVPQTTDIPAYTSLLSNVKYQQNYLYTIVGGICPNTLAPYDGSAYVKVGNPLFVSFPLPFVGKLSNVSAVGSFDFRLQASSPALGKGTVDATKIAPLNAVQVNDNQFMPTEVTLPGTDMGCFQSNGAGNQHSSTDNNIQTKFIVDGSLYLVTSPNTVQLISGGTRTGVIIIPSSVVYLYTSYKITSIGEFAFNKYTGITSVSIPSTVTSIKVGAFYNCNGITSIYSNSITPPVLTNYTNVFSQINKSSCKLYVPVGSKSSYQVSAQWGDFNNIIEITTTEQPTVLDDSIKVIPCPITNDFRIEGLSGIYTIILSDLNGKKILSKRIADNETVFVSSFAKGMYIVKLITDKCTIERKIIKN